MIENYFFYNDFYNNNKNVFEVGIENYVKMGIFWVLFVVVRKLFLEVQLFQVLFQLYQISVVGDGGDEEDCRKGRRGSYICIVVWGFQGGELFFCFFWWVLFQVWEWSWFYLVSGFCVFFLLGVVLESQGEFGFI